MKKLTPIEKAYRNVEKAKQVLIEKGEYDSEFETYQNRNAVRSAGKLLWRAEEIMINAVFNVKTELLPNPDIRDYINAVAQHDYKLSKMLEAEYLHLWSEMGGYGIRSKSFCDLGFRDANKFIATLAKLLPQQPGADASLPSQRAKLLTQQRPSQHPTRRTSQPSLQSA